MMKRLVLALLLICFALDAQVYLPHRRKAFRIVSCETLRDQNVGINPSGIDVRNTGVYLGTKFTAAASYTLCKAKISVSKIGSPTMTIDVRIYTDNAGAPGTEIGTRSGTVSASTFPGSEGEVEFTGLNVSISSGTTYWLVTHASGIGSMTDDWLWYHDETFASGATQYSADGSAWSVAVSRVCRFKTYSQ